MFINPLAWAVLTDTVLPQKVCEIPDGPGAHEKARLISTAPDGVELARLVVKYFGTEDIPDGMDCDIRLRDTAKAIIAKAEGIYESGVAKSTRTSHSDPQPTSIQLQKEEKL